MNRDQIKLQIADILADTDAVGKIDYFIELAEAEMTRRLGTLDMEHRATASVAVTTEFLKIPIGFMGLKAFRIILASGHKLPLRLVTDAHMSGLYSDAQGTPQFVAIVDDQFRLWPKATDETFEITYIKRFTPLSAVDNVNWISSDHPDAYIFGALAQAIRFVSAESLALYRGEFEARMNQIREYDVLKKSRGPLPQARPHRVAGDR